MFYCDSFPVIPTLIYIKKFPIRQTRMFCSWGQRFGSYKYKVYSGFWSVRILEYIIKLTELVPVLNTSVADLGSGINIPNPQHCQVIIYAKGKGPSWENCPKFRPLPQTPHVFYPTIFAVCSRTFGPLAGNSSTPLLPGWQSTGRAERKRFFVRKLSYIAAPAWSSRLTFLSDNFCVLQPNFQPPWQQQQHSSLAWLAK